MTCIYATICSFPQLVESCCVAQEVTLVLCRDLEGWDGEEREALEGGDKCTLIADSCCTTETNKL